MSYVTIQKLIKTTLDQRRWMKSHGVDVEKILSHPDLYGMQFLQIKDGKLLLEKLDPCKILPVRDLRRSDESKRLESMESVAILPGEERW